MANNLTATTPILKKLRNNGSTFYTFSGAVNDSLLLFSNKNINFDFSKFVCLKLPEWNDVTKQRLYRNPNDIESLNDSSQNDNPNVFLTKSLLQNYTENFSIISDSYREDNNFANTCESAFWKALINVSKNPDDNSDNSYNTLQLLEASNYVDSEGNTRTYFRERENTENEYEKLVKYVGDINMLNHVKSDGKEYMEIYCHIPTNSGLLGEIQFKGNESLNYDNATIPEEPSTDWVQNQQNNYENAPSSEKTYTKAIYDTNDKKYSIATDKDKLKIDWVTVESEDFQNEFSDMGNYEFNAVLIYYDIWDENDQANTLERNLYGILFMDSLENTAPNTWNIPSLVKNQPDDEQAGNAYGIRLNAMLSNSTNQLTTSLVSNDYNTVSMELYMKALENMQKITDKYNDLYYKMLAWGQDVEELKQYIISNNQNDG